MGVIFINYLPRQIGDPQHDPRHHRIIPQYLRTDRHPLIHPLQDMIHTDFQFDLGLMIEGKIYAQPCQYTRQDKDQQQDGCIETRYFR